MDFGWCEAVPGLFSHGCWRELVRSKTINYGNSCDINVQQYESKNNTIKCYWRIKAATKIYFLVLQTLTHVGPQEQQTNIVVKVSSNISSLSATGLFIIINVFLLLRKTGQTTEHCKQPFPIKSRTSQLYNW